MITAEKLLGLLKYGETLKNINRTGWVLLGAESERIESVAEHSYGSIITSIIIAQSLKSTKTTINVEKVAIMATLHDLPESITGDIARTEEFLEHQEHMKAKELAEKNAIKRMFKPLGANFAELRYIWDEFNLGESLESQVVKGADIIDMLLHARSLEKSGSSPQTLHQFFKSSKPIIESLDIEIVCEIYKLLYQEHELEARTQNIDLM